VSASVVPEYGNQGDLHASFEPLFSWRFLSSYTLASDAG
jgi:hypothetical protein